ncbi:MAG: class I tRNA ligase family protein [Desulfobacterales bacterium]|nr:class I tRNA ligase family protein [Desulfobacterales bacterium]
MDRVKDTAAFDGTPDALEGSAKALYQKTHQTIMKVTRDIEDRFHFNTAISAVMELFNMMSAVDKAGADAQTISVMRLAIESVTLLMAPIVPHFAEELWEALGNTSSILLAPWPTYQDAALEKDDVLIVIQVNGKLRSKFSVATDTAEETIKQQALEDPRIQKFTEGQTVKKVIYVKHKLVNIVV